MAGGTVIFTPQSLETKYHEAKMAAEDIAVNSNVAKTPEEIIVRDLLPTDIGAPNDGDFEQTINTSAAGTVTFYNKKLDGKAVVLFGVIVPPNTSTTKLIFKDNTTVKNVVYIAKGKYTKDGLILFDTPVKYRNDETVIIEGYVPDATNTTDNIQFLGVTAERAGVTISKQD